MNVKDIFTREQQIFKNMTQIFLYGLCVTQPEFHVRFRGQDPLLIRTALVSGTFYILLTVHLGVILVNDQLDALFNVFISRLYMF
jgi:hypothetical protein